MLDIKNIPVSEGQIVQAGQVLIELDDAEWRAAAQQADMLVLQAQARLRQVREVQAPVEIAAMGNLMGTTAKVRGLAGAVIDGAVRDISELRRLEFPVWSRRVSPATSVGRMISVDKQIPVKCGEIMVHPGDYIVADADGVVVVPTAAAEKVIEFLKQYDDKESKMIPIIEREKSMRKALEQYNRY